MRHPDHQKPIDDPRDHCADELNGQELARLRLAQDAQPQPVNRQATGEPIPLTPPPNYAEAPITSQPLPPPSSQETYPTQSYQTTQGYEPARPYGYPPTNPTYAYPQTYEPRATKHRLTRIKAVFHFRSISAETPSI